MPLTMMPARLPVLLFDFGGTLDAEGEPWKARFCRLSHDEGIRVAPDGFDRAFYAVDDALVGTVPHTLSLRETVERLARELVRRLEADDRAAASRVASRFLDEARQTLVRNTDLLRRLRPRFRLGVVSNFYGNLRTVLDEAGLTPYLDVVVDSTVVGCAKPDPRIFRAALQPLGARPTDAVFVGDSRPRDMVGARGVGMRHIWLRSPVGDAEDQPCCPDDPVIPSLTALESILT